MTSLKSNSDVTPSKLEIWTGPVTWSVAEGVDPTSSNNGVDKFSENNIMNQDYVVTFQNFGPCHDVITAASSGRYQQHQFVSELNVDRPFETSESSPPSEPKQAANNCPENSSGKRAPKRKLSSGYHPTFISSNLRFQPMALAVKVSRVTGLPTAKTYYYVALDYKTSLYKSEPVQVDGDCAKINQLFQWPLGSPLGPSDQLYIKLFQVAKVRSDKNIAVLPISLEQAASLRHIEVNEAFVLPDSNQATNFKIEMEIIYAEPGDDDGDDAMVRALTAIASEPDDGKSYQGGDENYDALSGITAISTPDGAGLKKKKGFGLKSKFGLKALKSRKKDSDALSAYELEPMIISNHRFSDRRWAIAAYPSASDPEIRQWLPPSPKQLFVRRRNKSPSKDQSDQLIVVSKSAISQNFDDEISKYEHEMEEQPSSDFISHRKRLDRLYKCKNYEALQTRSFQIHITIIEARQLSGTNIDPVVKVQVGTEIKSTASKTSTNCPYFNEFLLFDVRMPQQALLDQVITISVLHSKKLLSDEMIGQFRVDVATIFRYPDHTIGHKWVQLADPTDLGSPPKGFVKLCISIVAKGELISGGQNPTTAEGEDENIEKNLFTMGSSSSDGLWQTARYNLRIYAAEQLPSASSSGLMTGFKRALKSNDAALLDPFVIGLFAGQQGRTTVKKATTSPEWNEQISFIDMFPPPCRRLALQVRDSGFSENLIACHYIDLYTVSNEGKSHTGGYLPVFGPCWVNLYGALEPGDEMATRYGEPQTFRGRILVELHTELLDNPEPTAIQCLTDSCSPCDKAMLPVRGDLLLMCGVHSVDMVDGKLKEKPAQIQLSLGPYPEIAQPADVQSSSRSKSTLTVREDAQPLLGGFNERGESDKVMHITPTLSVKPADGDFGCIPLQFKKPLLAIHYAVEDQRKQATTVNMLEKIACELDDGLYRARQSIKQQRFDVAVVQIARTLKQTVARCNTFNRLSKSSSVVGRQSRLFENWLKQTRDALSEMITTCSRTKNNLNQHSLQDALSTLSRLIVVVDTLLQPREQDFPDLFVWIVGPDQRKWGYARIPVRSLQFSEVPEECGLICGKMETFKLLAPDRTNAHVASITLSGWHGLHRDWPKAFELLPKGILIPPTTSVPSSLVYKESQRFQLRCYLYQARGIRGLDDTGLSDPFAVVHVQSRAIQSRVINETLSPIWDETLLINDVEVWGNRDSIRDRPPVVTLNIYDYDDPENCELIGVAYLNPLVRFSADLPRYQPPQLQWFKLISPKSFADSGEVLAAVELLQMEDEALGTTQLPALDIPDDILSDSPMPVPRGIRPTLSRYRIEILFWGLRELSRVQLLSVDRPRLDIELSGQTIQSDVIQNAQSFPNFACLIKAIEMDLPDNDIFCPPLMIRCVDCRSFGRQLLVGSAAVPNISAFFYSDEDDAKSVVNITDFDDGISMADVDLSGNNPAVSALARNVPPALQSVEQRSIAPTSERDSSIGYQQEAMIDGYLMPTAMATALAPIDPQLAEGVMSVAGLDEMGFGDSGMIDDRGSPSVLKNFKKLPKIKVYLRIPPMDDDFLKKMMVKHDSTVSETPGQPSSAPPPDDEEETDWWTKYYATMDELKKYEQEQASMAGKTLMPGGIGAKGKLGLFKRSKSKTALAVVNKDGGGFDNGAFVHDQGYVSKKKKPAEENVRVLKVYNSELESYFRDFEDFIKTFELNRGKEDEDADPAQKRNNRTGKFKGNIRVSRLNSAQVGLKPLRDDLGRSILFHNLPPSTIVPVLVRIYVVRAYDLYPKDMNGKSDPYIAIRLGKTVLKDKDNYVSKQLNPIFGRCFDVKATLPFDNMLTVQIYDWDLVGTDELIGETKIDIESRFYSKFRPTCGLPLCYERNGYNAWRDSSRPTHLLAALCRKEGLDPPIYEQGKVVVGRKLYQASNWEDELPDGNEHLALSVLNNWDKVAGYKMVPEHIENRLLFDPAQPGQVMGHLEMWVDMFPSDKGNIPPPIDISPRKPKSYELRCIIWNTEDVILDDVSITGEKMSDIYVKGYLTGPEDTQQTDVHYRSLTGEGNFNWRFVFKFDYLSCEQKIVVKRKENMLSWDESEEKLPARLTLQVWDADLVAADDFLGSLVLDLNCLPRGAKDGKDCTPDMVSPDTKCPMTSLFKQRRMRGYWPFTVKNETTQEIELTGKVEAEFQLLTADEAAARPAGLGRDPPDPMEKPNRPDTSFLWFTNPFKSLRYILCTKFKWLFIKLLIIAAFAALLVLFIYSVPGWMGKRIVGA